MRYSKEWLLQQKNKLDFTFFWGPEGVNGYLDQWYHSPFKALDGENYLNCEQFNYLFMCKLVRWMMAEKARLFGDKNAEEEILASLSPSEVQKLGRTVTNFDHDIWESNCRNIVIEGNMMKFEQNPDLLEKLLSTGDSVIAEASP
jgi:ribA/ribD-fused uncharacterized protein